MNNFVNYKIQEISESKISFNVDNGNATGI